MKFHFVWSNSVFFACIICTLLLANCTSSSENKNVMLVAVAASTLNVMDTLAKSFHEKTGHKIEIIHGSSGKLATQITQSAPYSLFFSADKFYPDFLTEKRLSTTKPKVYAQGKLAIWFRNKHTSDISILKRLKNEDIKKVALANTSTAPYGKAAYNWLKNVDMLEEVSSKLIYGESIAQLNTYIIAGTVDAAFTAFSSLQLSTKNLNGYLLVIPEEEYPPIQQAAIITKYGKEHFPEQSRSFLNFVLSNSGQAILKRYGYSNPEN